MLHLLPNTFFLKKHKSKVPPKTGINEQSELKNFCATGKMIVVRFLEENTISEVPSIWLDQNKCWWPHKNSKTHIMKEDVPGSTKGTFWQKYDVEILKTDLTYVEARKKAANDMETSEDDTGPRKRKINKKHFDDHDHSDSDEGTLLSRQPKFKNQDQNVKNTGNKTVETDEIKKQSVMKELDIEDIPIIISNEKRYGIVIEEIRSDVQQIFNDEEITKEPTLESESSEIHSSEVTTYVQKDILEVGNNDPFRQMASNSEKPSSVHALKNNLSKNNPTEGQDVMRMFAKILITLESIDKRLKNLEDKHNQNKETVAESALILQFIPFRFDSLKEVDSVLKSNEEIREQMKKVVVQVGGNNPKDFIYRVLTKLFPNECAVKCSWKGLKNNFAVCNLSAIKIMIDKVLQYFPYSTEKELENITAEWFRFAKQRLERQLKKST